MAPDPKRLLELLQIAKHGSYTRAAAAQGISQPALSNSIAVLERSLGVRLLDRTRHGATLTDFGRLLASHAESLDALLARASEDVRLKKLGMEGSLAVGISPVASVELVPNAIARVKHETPDISVRIYERPDDQLLESLRSGEIDAMVSPAGLLTDLRTCSARRCCATSQSSLWRRGHPGRDKKPSAWRSCATPNGSCPTHIPGCGGISRCCSLPRTCLGQ